MTTPSRAAQRLVRWATYALPRGSARDRYRREVTAELHDLAPRDQMNHALRFAGRAWALRPALHGQDPGTEAVTARPAPWWCRLRLHHRDRLAFTDDGGRFQRCIDCGRDSPWGGGRTNDSSAWAGVVHMGPQ